MRITKGKTEDALVMRLAWPCVLENLSATMVSLVDTAMVGSLGAASTAAVGVCASPSWLMNGLVQALGVGGTALVARYIGAGEKAEAEHVASQTLRVAVLMSVAIMALMFFGAPLIPIIMQAQPEVYPLAISYLRITSASYFIYYTGMAMSALLRGAGDTTTPMKSGLMANFVNILLNFLLIYAPREVSVLGKPIFIWGADLGVRGAAIATAIATGLSAVYLLLHMFGRKSALRLRLGARERWDAPLLKRIARIGAPAALERAAINLGQIVFASMISGFGTAQIAAYHITINVEGIGYMPAYGFSAAATALVGQRLGAGKPAEAERLGKRSIHLSLLLLVLAGALMFLLRNVLASLFSPDAQVVEIAAAFIGIVAAEQPFNAISIVASGALRGAGDTVRPFVYGLITMWGVRILGAWLLGVVLGGGIYVIFWAMVVDLGVRSAMLYVRFLRGKWKLARV